MCKKSFDFYIYFYEANPLNPKQFNEIYKSIKLSDYYVIYVNIEYFRFP